MKNQKLFWATAMLLLGYFGLANNINVTGTTLTNRDLASHTVKINFNVSWENSWRTSTNESNYDGAWIFVKYRINQTGAWRHCTLKTAGFNPATGSEIKVAPLETDNLHGKGAFIYRDANGIGNVVFDSNQLIWDYGIDNVLDNATVEIKVFAIEMVYIPQGSYFLGSGGTENNHFKDGNTNNPFHVIGPGAIAIGTASGQLSFNNQGSGTSIPSDFPNGYNAFWMMKYEASRQQYADFLNTVEFAQATTLNPGTNYFAGVHPNLSPLGSPDWPASVISCENAMALADWSALRPMSEMEFEKACRGVSIAPVPDEYAWGTTAYSVITSVNSAGQPEESIANPLDANVIFNISAINNPIRVGIFARSTDSSRQKSGASYYGVMNMSDNMYETVIYSGSAQGQSIKSNIHGNGYLNADGTTDQVTWQALQAFGVRGSAWTDSPNLGKVSYRGSADAYGNYEARGMRMVRTAP